MPKFDAGKTFIINSASDLASFILDFPIESVADFYNIGVKNLYNSSRSNAFCPFHSETKPSMLLGGKGNFAYCFSCARSWTPIQFVRDMEKCSFIEAVKHLANIAGVSIPADVLKEIRQNQKLLWKRTKESDEQKALDKNKEYDKLRQKFIGDFIKLYIHEKNWKYFYADVDYCWGIFDDINSKEVTLITLDLIKDWFSRCSKYIIKRKLAWRNFDSWKLETYKEFVEPF